MIGAAPSGELARGVTRAARLSAHLPEGERRTALRDWLARTLAGATSQEIRQRLRELLEAFPPPPEAAPAAPTAPQTQTVPLGEIPLERLYAFAKKYYGKDWEPSGDLVADVGRALEALGAVESRLAAVARLGGGEPGTLSAALDVLEVQSKATDGALREAAQESLSRLLEALSPAALEAHAGKKGVRLGVFHKAGLYETWCEKFEQLKAYHDAGRLVGDLRASFRRNLKDSAQEEQRR